MAFRDGRTGDSGRRVFSAHALTYSLTDAGIEALLFAVLAGYLYYSMGVRVVPTFATYVKAAHMSVPMAAVCTSFTPVYARRIAPILPGALWRRSELSLCLVARQRCECHQSVVILRSGLSKFSK
jgi:hypothetical protein